MSKKNEQKISRILYLVILILLLLVLVSPFAISLIFGGTVALALFPLQLHIEQKGFTRKKVAAFLTTCFTIIISIPLFFFLVKGTMAVTDQLEKISNDDTMKDQGMQEIVTHMRHDAVEVISKYAHKIHLEDFLTNKKINTYLKSANTYLLDFFQSIATSLPVLFLLLLIMILCTYSFLKNATHIRNFFQSVFGFDDKKTDRLINIFINDSRQVYISNLATGGIQSVMVASGVALLGLGDFFLVFFITLILSFIPVIGAAPVAFTFAIIAFFKDNNTAAIILLVLGIVTGVVDNILRPWLATFGESRIPPIVAFVTVLGGAILMGFPGLFIGLLIGSIAYDTVPVFWEELSHDSFFDR